MKRQLKRIPEFRSEDAERTFWAAADRDSTEYLDWNKARLARYPNVKLSTRSISLRLPVSLLERIWAPDFTYVTPDGSVFGKEKGIADVSKMSGNVSSAENSNLKIRVYGGSAAVVTGDYHVAGRDQDGKSFDARSRFTNVWVLRNGVWQCVSGHSSVLASN